MKYDISEMMSLDIFMSSMAHTDHNKIKPHINQKKMNPVPLMSWDILSQNYFGTLTKLKIESDIKMVKLFAEKAKWKNEIDAIFEENDFHALIITDIEQKILWVNNGFTEMTGYSKKFTLNKTPHFLQGLDTLPETKTRIRKKLNNLEPFTQVITNYKKDNSPYKCHVKIIPMYNENVTHFLAIEKQVI